MRMHNFIIATGGVANDNASTTVPGGHAGTVTISSSASIVESSGFMSADGLTMTVNDGSSNRTILFTSGPTDDNHFDNTGLGDVATFRDRLIAAVNGSDGGAVNVTASAGTGASVLLNHDSGGKITVTFGGTSTSTTSAIKGGVTYLSGSPSAAMTSEVDVPGASSVATGSIEHAAMIKTPTVGKVSLRDNSGDPLSHGAFNVFMEPNSIVNDGSSFVVSGSLSANSDPTSTVAKRVRGDAVIISNYQK